MQKIILDITMSLDGFIAGPDISPEHPLGIGGPKLHDWLFQSKTSADDEVMKEVVDHAGAVIVGNRTYSTAIDSAWESHSPFAVPAFVLCHQLPESRADGFQFVQDGIISALTKAKAAAGDKNIWIMGGANIIQQYIQAGLFDELHIHIVPLLFVKGTKLFDQLGDTQIELTTKKVLETKGAIHCIFERKK